MCELEAIVLVGLLHRFGYPEEVRGMGDLDLTVPGFVSGSLQSEKGYQNIESLYYADREINYVRYLENCPLS